MSLVQDEAIAVEQISSTRLGTILIFILSALSIRADISNREVQSAVLHRQV